jgi:hypothetical protein
VAIAIGLLATVFPYRCAQASGPELAGHFQGEWRWGKIRSLLHKEYKAIREKLASFEFEKR